MSGQAKQEIPRFSRKNRRKPAPGPVVVLRGRHAARYAADAHAAAAAQAPGTPAPRTPPAGVLARTGIYKFRRHLVPFWWLLAVLCTGLGAHQAHAWRAGVLIGVLGAAGLWLFTRHLSRFAKRAGHALAVLTLIWVPVLSLAGLARPWPVLLLACWLVVLWPWAKHYRWRPEEKKDEPKPDASDIVIWNRLAAKNKWEGHLEKPANLPGGGRQWQIGLVGAETHIGQVLAEPRRIAAAWGKSIAEAYAEPSPDGIESRGLLTILTQNTLEKSREWDGAGIDPETGMAETGWFPDGQPVHERYFVRMNGIRHTIVAGADGSGKSGLLDLGLCLSATSGIITPIILDPQEGQALPAWKDHVPYARGADECMAYVYGIHAAMLDRSRYLAGLTWKNEEGDERRGMGFFDPFLTGLPIIEITLDESPALLTHPKYGAEAVRLLAETGKMGRKVGFRLRFAIQVPSLAEFGGAAQALRSMLVGGNVFCGRTGDKVTQGMINAAADPSALPKYFRDGKPTVGIGYASGPDNRPGTIMRSMWVKDPYKVARSAAIRPLDDRCAEAMERGMLGRGAKRIGTAPAAPVTAAAAPLAAVPAPEDDKPGRTAADAILAVLDKEMHRGQIINACKALVATWEPPRATFSVKALGDALRSLTAADQIDKTVHGSYAPRKTELHAVADGEGRPA